MKCLPGLLLLCASSVFAAEAVDLAGVVDHHAHSAPEVVARSANSFAVVRAAKEAGLRAVVLKNHYVATATLAQLAQADARR